MVKLIKTATLSMLGSASLLVLSSTAVSAQSAPATAGASAPDGKLDEIVVTAQRRSEPAQRVGIAISTITSKQLADYNLSSAVGISGHVAAVDIAQPNGTGAYTFSVRGVTQNDFADHQEPPTAVYVDGVYLSQMAGLAFQLLDIDRVEVLRGPQGTLFGRNATGGLAQFVSVRPSKKTSGFVEATVGTRGLVRGEAALGGPLTSGGGISGRISAEYQHRDYLFHGVNGGRPSENDNQLALRGQLLADLGPSASLLLISNYGRQRNVAGAWESIPAGINSAGLGYDLPPGSLNGLGYPASGAYGSVGDTRGFANNESYGQSATLVAPVGSGTTLTVVGDYQHLKKAYLEDSDTSPDPVFHFFSSSDVNQYSGEARLNGSAGNLTWIGGVYFLKIDGRYTEGAYGAAYGGAATSGGLYDPYSVNTTSYAGFAQIDYALTDKLKATVGARYTWDRKRFDYSATYPGFAVTFNEATDGGKARLRDSFWSGKVGLNYQATPSLLLYASANRGVKAGGFNAPLDPTPIVLSDVASFRPETLDDYEFGFKSEFLGRRLRINGSLYYYDYKNYQALQFINLTQLILNAPARYKGGELEIVYRPIARLQLEGNFAYNHAVIKGLELDALGPHDYRPANAPRVNMNGLARYTAPMAGGSLTVQGEASYQSHKYFALTNAPDTEQKAFTLANLRLIYDHGPIQLNLAVTNLFDKHYATMKFDLAGFFGLAQAYPGRPREYSASVRYKF